MASQASPSAKTRTRAHYPVTHPYRTRWLDNDMYAHVNNSVYYLLFDSIVNDFLIAHGGATPGSASPSSAIGLVVHSHCDYFAPVAFPAVLDVCMRVRKLGRSSVTYETAVFAQGEDDVKAVGEFVHVFVQRESRRPLADGMTSQLRDALEGLVQKQPKL